MNTLSSFLSKFQLTTVIISLIVVHTSANSNKTSDDIKDLGSYVGCFRYVTSTNDLIFPSTLKSYCISRCRLANLNLIAVSKFNACQCVQTLGPAVSSALCNYICQADQSCLSTNYYFVYRIGPQKIHHAYYCTNDKMNTFDVQVPAQTSLETCAHICLELNYTFLQTLRKEVCSCIKTLEYGIFHRTKLTCNELVENSLEIKNCHYTEHENKTTIYTTRFSYDFQRGVSSYSHCKNKKYEIAEKCADGCSEGWMGDSCRNRDCRQNNGDCGSEMKCVEVVVNNQTYVECVCPYGTVRTRWDVCEVFKFNLVESDSCSLSSTFYDRARNISMEATYLSDHSIDGYTAAQINDNIAAWIAVTFQKLYAIGFVKVYGKLCQDEKDCSRLNNFLVKLSTLYEFDNDSDIRSLLELCGKGPDHAVQAGTPMTVVCKNFTLLSRSLIIQQSNEKFSLGNSAIAELEVFEVGCDTLNGRCKEDQKCTEEKMHDATVTKCTDLNDLRSAVAPFYGCFRWLLTQYHLNRYGLSYQECQDECRARKFDVAAVKAGINCSCGNQVTVGDEAPMDDCRKQHYLAYYIYHDCKVNQFCGATTKTNTSVNANTTATTAEPDVISKTESTDMNKKFKDNNNTKLIIIVVLSLAIILTTIGAVVLLRSRFLRDKRGVVIATILDRHRHNAAADKPAPLSTRIINDILKKSGRGVEKGSSINDSVASTASTYVSEPSGVNTGDTTTAAWRCWMWWKR
ncbi:hypothetical protein HELRODRAFT_176352 [Helobdella robusta]|uniref:WSC domain-containing protein n=1 Tax=Helobdella robusta TaxID=6412 RepID=T1FAF3_HELRO|nr:hypothetical protein HELRODRAFT_176352 [Helobdella robusta]ESO00044.1 hypothetical protein HELRODRAFT_176352 [Helobdella robusta]